MSDEEVREIQAAAHGSGPDALLSISGIGNDPPVVVRRSVPQNDRLAASADA